LKAWRVPAIHFKILPFQAQPSGHVTRGVNRHRAGGLVQAEVLLEVNQRPDLIRRIQSNE